LEQDLGLRATLMAGGGGIFDVEYEHRIVFSKFAEGDRFPRPGELSERIRALS